MEYAEKNEADQQRMIELEQQKVLEKDQYLQQIMELRRVHTKIISELEKEQTLQKDQMNIETKKLREQI